MALYNIPTGDFEATNLVGALTSTSSSATVGTGLFIPATNGVMHVDYDSTLNPGADNGPETILYAAYNTVTGAVTGLTRGAGNTFGSGGAGTGGAHVNNATVAFGPSVLFFSALQPVSSSVQTFTNTTTADDGTTQAIVNPAVTAVTNLSRTITSRGGNVLVGFSCPASASAGSTCLWLMYDGATMVAKGSFAFSASGQRNTVSATVLLTPAAGSHTYTVQMTALAGGVTLTALTGQTSMFAIEQSA